jgi:hypothetical protein
VAVRIDRIGFQLIRINEVGVGAVHRNTHAIDGSSTLVGLRITISTLDSGQFPC